MRRPSSTPVDRGDRNGFLCPVALALCLAGAPAARAETSATFQASATIVSGCEVNGTLPSPGDAIGTLGTLDFGEHSALATGTVTAGLTANGSIALSCTPGVALTMSLDGGEHATTTRNLQAGSSAQRVSYRLYADAAFSQELLAGQAFAVNFSDPEHVSLPVYGRAALSGNGAVGTYSDTVAVTLNW